MTKLSQDYEMTDRKGVISAKYETKLSRLIKQSVVYDEDETDCIGPLYVEKETKLL